MLQTAIENSYPFISELFSVALVFVLGYFALTLWLHYKRTEWISGIEWILLEVKPPRDVLRSPKAMELFFTNALYHLSTKKFKKRFKKGEVRLWFSLEIVSIDGNVHFYIRTPSKIRGLVEAQMYAQYPQSEIKEVEDYSLGVYSVGKQSIWDFAGFEFQLTKADPYPINTYVDFGLDKDPKEEYKVDPLSPLVELFGSIQNGEQVWMQIVVMANDKKYYKKGSDGEYHDLMGEAQATIGDITKGFTSTKDDKTKEIRSMPWHKELIEAINRKVTKLNFEVGIRVCYVAKKESANGNNKKALRTIFQQFNSPHMNSFKTANSDSSMGFLHQYQNREFFYFPFRHGINKPWPFTMISPNHPHSKTFVLNTEELATIWHFPGQILKAPGLERVESKESSPPSNLPI